MMFDEDTNDLTAFNETQTAILDLWKEGKLFIEIDGYPLTLTNIAFYEDGRIYIQTKHRKADYNREFHTPLLEELQKADVIKENKK